MSRWFRGISASSRASSSVWSLQMCKMGRFVSKLRRFRQLTKDIRYVTLHVELQHCSPKVLRTHYIWRQWPLMALQKRPAPTECGRFSVPRLGACEVLPGKFKQSQRPLIWTELIEQRSSPSSAGTATGYSCKLCAHHVFEKCVQTGL